MITETERDIMKIRKHAAINTLSFFKKKVHVRSTNLMNPFECVTKNEFNDLNEFRDNQSSFSLHNSMAYATRTGIGNCEEKASICYMSLKSNPTLLFNSFFSICQVHGGDHGFIIINDTPLKNRHAFYMHQLRKTTMILDGWTEDWSFPNLDLKDSLEHHLTNFPNPHQFSTRRKIKRSLLVCYSEDNKM